VEEAEEDHLDFEQGAVVSADEGAVPGHKQLLQTFVFSATLTLPAQLHKRLRRGGGGSSGAASLDSLMDRCHACSCRPAVLCCLVTASCCSRHSSPCGPAAPPLLHAYSHKLAHSSPLVWQAMMKLDNMQ
jgi:hypothetical protein